MNGLRHAVTGFLAVRVAVNVVNWRTFPRLRPSERADLSRVSVLVPARDEAATLPHTLPLLAAQGAGEVLVLDDGSEDGTAEVAAAVAGVQVLAGRELPPGWLGKAWALHQLAEAASGEWLVFTDADVHWEPGALAGFLDELEAQESRVGSIFPSQDTRTWGERLTVPVIDEVLLSGLPYPLLHAQVSPLAVAANGQAIAIHREIYDAIGGWESVRGRIVEDVAFGRLARRQGNEVALALGDGTVHTRMYRGYREVMAGFGKNLLTAHAGRRSLLVADIAWHLAAYTLPALLAPRSRAWRLPLALGVAQRALVAATTTRHPAEALLAPLLPVAGLPVAAGALRRRQRWKGRDIHVGGTLDDTPVLDRHPDSPLTPSDGTGLPSPAGHPVHGHLGRWGTEPLALLEEGSELGPLFELRLPRKAAVVGTSPAWNRFVLRDGETFVARRSMAALIPHLAGGIIVTDAPVHRPRRQVLEPRFRDVERLRARVRGAVEALDPPTSFDGLAWSLQAVPAMLNAALFSGSFPDDLLAAYLHPLEQGMPAALVPRPGPRRAVRRELAAQLRRREHDPQADDLAAALATVPGAVEELRVGLAAGFDTSAHTLAWALWYLAAHPAWQPAERRRQAVDEVLRLHPPGFIGSRRVARATEFEGVRLPVGTLVFYSPMLTHRRPELWRDPDTFDPRRFDAGFRAWTYIPFSAGQRTCLGTHLARLMLDEALDVVLQRPLRAVDGDPSPTAAVTIAPRGPLRLHRDPAAGGPRSNESDRP